MLTSVVTSLDGPYSLKLANGSLYWIEGSGTSQMVRGLSLDAGSSPVLFASNQYDPGDLVVHGDALYWTENAPSVPAGTVETQFPQVVRQPLDGGSASILAQNFWYGDQAYGLAVDDNFAYWCSLDDGIQKVPLDGGASSTINMGTAGLTCPVVVANGTLYAGLDTVYALPFDGGSPSQIGPAGNQTIQSIAADSQFVYWLTWQGGVYKVPIGGGTVSTLVEPSSTAGSGMFPDDLAVDQGAVYWSRLSDGALSKFDLRDGGVTLLGPSGKGGSIVVDETSIYWTEGPSILKLTPK